MTQKEPRACEVDEAEDPEVKGAAYWRDLARHRRLHVDDLSVELDQARAESKALQLEVADKANKIDAMQVAIDGFEEAEDSECERQAIVDAETVDFLAEMSDHHGLMDRVEALEESLSEAIEAGRGQHPHKAPPSLIALQKAIQHTERLNDDEDKRPVLLELYEVCQNRIRQLQGKMQELSALRGLVVRAEDIGLTGDMARQLEVLTRASNALAGQLSKWSYRESAFEDVIRDPTCTLPTQQICAIVEELGCDFAWGL